jgi:hypothetical protein
MTAIWRNDGTGWSLSAPIGFPDEQTLHDLVEATPRILPLVGDPRLVVVGKEVGWATVKKKAERLRSQRKLDPRIWPNEASSQVTLPHDWDSEFSRVCLLTIQGRTLRWYSSKGDRLKTGLRSEWRLSVP